MDINLFVLASIIVRLLGLASLLILVLPVQLREVRREVNEFTSIRWILLIINATFILTNVFPFGLLFHRLDSGTYFTLQNIATISAAIGVFIIAIGFTVIYRFSLFSKLKRR